MEPQYFKSIILYNLITITNPLVSLYFSKNIINSIFEAKDLPEVMVYVGQMVFFNLLMMMAGGYLQSRNQYYTLSLSKQHIMEKAKKLMEIEYYHIETDKLQNTMSELQYLETTGIHNFSSFGKNVGIFIGNLTGIVISTYFSIAFLKADFDYRGFSNGTINFMFVILFILLNVLSFNIISKSNKETGQASNETNHIFRYVRSYLNIIYNYRVGKDIRLYNRALADNVGEVYRGKMSEIYTSFWSVYGKGIIKSELLSNLLSVVISLFVGIKAIYGTISVGEIMLYIGTINLISTNANEMVRSLSVIISSDLYREKLYRFMELNSLVKNEDEGLIQKARDGRWEIEFKNVSFKYPDSNQYALKNINLKIKTGEKLALVGTNGSGKTTLIKLLLRLYKPTEGQITLNGSNISNYQYDDYLDIFSVVFQDFRLLSLTLGENVAISSEYHYEEVKKSLQKVGLSEFIEKHDLNTYLYRELNENGMEISGGEAQKIAMARALHKKGQIIILDEPTAALDPISEHEIYSRFNELIGENMAIYISHRLSSCCFCNSICVLHDGVLLQQGSHEELLSDVEGKYHQLWTSQAQYYKVS